MESNRKPAICDTDHFPGWARFPAFLNNYVAQNPNFRALDLGGGANPMLGSDASNPIKCDLLDIDESELSKAPKTYNRLLCIDGTIGEDKFLEAIGECRYDLTYSHMFLEHIRNPDQLHKNVFCILKAGGIAIHAYPCRYNLPLAINSIIPEAISRAMVKIAQPNRDLEGNLGKFPAYYSKCYPPSKTAQNYFGGLGYSVLSHIGYAGHGYYNRIPFLQQLEKLPRRFAVKTQIPWVLFNVLVLQKPHN